MLLGCHCFDILYRLTRRSHFISNLSDISRINCFTVTPDPGVCVCGFSFSSCYPLILFLLITILILVPCFPSPPLHTHTPPGRGKWVFYMTYSFYTNFTLKTSNVSSWLLVFNHPTSRPEKLNTSHISENFTNKSFIKCWST